MRIPVLTFLIGALSLWAAEAPARAAAALNMEHPGNVALIEGNNGFSYIHAETGFRLYVTDRDKNGKSSCNAGCARAWVPLAIDDADTKPIGDWSIVNRDDGTRQWAYKGHPVYTLFHDSPEKPIGNGVEGVWHFLEP